MKICKSCKRELDISNFYKLKTSKDGLASTCKACFKAYHRVYYSRSDVKIKRKKYFSMDRVRIRNREIMLERNRGVTPTQYNEMLSKQNGVCAICKKPETSTRNGRTKNLCVDHDHVTGTNRALLCHACNSMIGYARESTENLYNAIEYIRFWKQAIDIIKR